MTSPSSPAIARPGREPRATAVPVHRIRAIRAWCADRESTGPRRRLQVALGLAWLLDAALQYQPFMFSRAFPAQVIAASAAGSPGPVAAPVLAVSRLILHDPAACNAAFATTQLVLAAGLLWRPAVRAALAASVAWSLAIWWLGECLGGMFTGAASPLSGAPGAVLLYALLALLAWPARAGDRERARSTDASMTDASMTDASMTDASVADGSPLGGRWSRILWLVLWGSSAYLILQPRNRAPGALRASIAALAAGEPRWIAALDQSAAAAAGRGGALTPVLLAAAFAVTGAGILVPATVRLAVTLSIILAVIIWVTGENFGGMLTGQATDPNSGPLLVLLALAFWPRPGLKSAAGPARPPSPAATPRHRPAA